MPIQPSLRADIIYPASLREGDSPPSPNDPYYAWHILAEGDSWFTLGGVPSSSLLFELCLAKWTRVLNLAYPGDTIVDVDKESDKDLHTFLAKQNFNYPFDAILLSCGGNDVIDAARELVDTKAYRPDLRDPDAYIRHAPFDDLLQTIQSIHGRIAALRDKPDSLSKGCPIFTHTYDYPTARNAKSRLFNTFELQGPWLYPVFQDTPIDVGLQQLIVNRIMDKLAEALLALDCIKGEPGRQLDNFHVIDTRNTLIPANPADVGNSHDWLNEIHPNFDGYRKIADKLSAGINKVLMGP